MPFCEVDYKKIDANMLLRIAANPVEAKGCIQYFIEMLARREAEIGELEFTIMCDENIREVDQKFIEKCLEAYVMPKWYKRVWNAFWKIGI